MSSLKARRMNKKDKTTRYQGPSKESAEMNFMKRELEEETMPAVLSTN